MGRTSRRDRDRIERFIEVRTKRSGVRSIGEDQHEGYWATYTKHHEVYSHQGKPVTYSIIGRLAEGYCSWPDLTSKPMVGSALIEPLYSKDADGIKRLLLSGLDGRAGEYVELREECQLTNGIGSVLRNVAWNFALFPHFRNEHWHFALFDFAEGHSIGLIDPAQLRSCDNVGLEFRVFRSTNKSTGRVTVGLVAHKLVRITCADV